MHVCIVGGIFGKSVAHGAAHRHTPETTLADGLRAAGHVVTTVGHDTFTPSDAYDVIHVHHVGRAAFLMAATPSRAPFVFTGHDGKLLCGYERNPIRRAAFREILLRCDVAVALSGAEAAFLDRLARPERVAVIANGIPDATYAASALEGPPERGGLVYAGQLIPLKGVDTLLRAVALLRRRADAQLTLAYHNALLEDSLRSLAVRLGIADRVRFAGSHDVPALAALYRASSVFVLPSRAESLPSVVVEALLAGTPVVGTDVGGIREQIGPFGAVVPPGDPRALADAIAAVLDHPPTPAERAAMREHARTRYSPAEMIAAHLRLYASIAVRRRVRRHALDPALRAAIWAYWEVTKPTVTAWLRRRRRRVPAAGPT